MNTAKAIETLKKEAEKNEAAREVFKMWSGRERGRDQVTVRALKLRMDSETKKRFASEDYAKVLKAVGQAGFGQLKYNRKGDVDAIVGIGVTLQSLGLAALGKGQTLVALRKFHPLRQSVTDMEEIPQTVPQMSRLPDKITSIAVPLNGVMTQIPIPDGLTDEQLGSFIKRLLGK